MNDVTPQSDRPRSGVRAGFVFVLVLVAGGLGIFGYRFAEMTPNGPAKAQAPAKPAPVPQLVREGQRISITEGSQLRNKLAVEAVAEKEIQRSLVLPAVVEADPARLIKVLPPLAGRVTRLDVQLGERVQTGQPLVVLDSPDLAAAYADYDRAKVLLALAQKNRDRQRDLTKVGGGALKEQQQAETDYITAEVELERAQARLKQIGVEAEPKNQSKDKPRTVTVTASMPGSVIDLAAAPGAYWNDPNAALMTIADLSSVWVTANVPEKDTAFVSKGQAVDVAFGAYPDEAFKGQVLFVSDVLDPETRRSKVRIPFQNPEIRLKPNMFANVTFYPPKQTVAVVPTTALVLRNDGNQVYVEVEPWTFEPRTVEISFQQGNEAIIKSGLKAGERVVVKGAVLLND
jgi:membrane fusion protein, heavy metal efflux system